MQRPSAKRAIKENTSERARHYRQLPLLVAVFAGGSIRAVHLRKVTTFPPPPPPPNP